MPARTGGRRRFTSAVHIAALSLSFVSSSFFFERLAQAKADQIDRDFSAIPRIGLEGIFTDNAEIIENGRKSDFILRGLLGLDAQVHLGRAVGQLSTTLTYDHYAKLTELSGASLTAVASGAYELMSDVLWFEADGAVVTSRNEQFGASAVDRSGVAGRTQLAVYEIGPRLAATLGDRLDVAAAAKFGQVLYTEADASVVDTPLPEDGDTWHVTFQADTADRTPAYQLLTTAQFDDDDQGFRAAGGLQSLYVRVAPRVRLIGRAGYDWVRQLGIPDISAPVLSAGVEYSPNRRSKVSIEGGRRYERPAWAASADVAVSDRLVLRGAYTEAIQPDQLFVASTFRRFVEQSRTPLPPTSTPTSPSPLPPPAPAGFIPPPGVYQQTSLNKVATLDLAHRDERQSLRLSASWIDRKFLLTNTHDRTVGASIGYQRALRRDLSLLLDANYARTLESPLYGETESYGFTGQLDYRLNSSTRAYASYAFASGEQRFPGGQTIHDNTVLVGLTKSF
jgi:hypothetical protein